MAEGGELGEVGGLGEVGCPPRTDEREKKNDIDRKKDKKIRSFTVLS